MNFPLSLAELSAEFPRAVRQDRLVSAIRNHLGCGAVGLLKLDGKALCPVAVAGLSPETLGRRFTVDQHPRLAAILAQRSVVHFEPGSSLPDPYDGLLESKLGKPLPIHDCMGIALFQNDQCWGILTLDSVEGLIFSASVRNSLTEIGHYCEAVIRMCQLEDDIRALRVSRHLWDDSDALPELPDDSKIIGRSPVIQQLLRELDIVAESELPVLLLGETGVGKELLARRVHRQSPRRHVAMVHVNCAALPESLAESELFGHVKGAFSGAVHDRAGRFEVADGGVLFLDEVGELPLSIQAKLLRTLQNGEIQRLGSDQLRRVDVRIIAATNRDLAEQVKRGGFRADLYHRLSVYPVVIPPLRERGDDVLMLAGYFLELNRARLGFRSLRLSPAAEQILRQYRWPGNIRELEHAISRASLRLLGTGVVRTSLAVLEPEHLALDLSPGAETASVIVTLPEQTDLPSDRSSVALKDAVDQFQRGYIAQALAQTDQHWTEAARLLHLDPSNLHKLARRLGLK